MSGVSMMIGRLIVTNSILMLLMFGNPQAANNTIAVATNFPMPGKGIAALFRQKNRHAMILSFGASGEPFRTEQQAVACQLFRSADRFRPSRLGESGLAR